MKKEYQLKTLRTITILLFVFSPMGCDIFDDLDCSLGGHGWVRFANISANHTFKVSLDDYYKCTLSPNQVSSYYSINASREHSVEWDCIDCTPHVSDCGYTHVDVQACDSTTYACSK